MTSSDVTSRSSPSSSRYWNSSCPGRSWQRRTIDASADRERGARAAARLPRNPKRTRDPSSRACRSRIVVRPNEWLARAYSSLPTRIERRVEQAHDRARSFVARQAESRQVLLGSAADARQRFGEGDHPLELGRHRGGRDTGVIAVLLAAASIAARGLEVAVRPRTDPDIGPGRWDGESRDAPASVRIADRRPVHVAIGPAATGPATAPTGPGVGRIAQAATSAASRASVESSWRHRSGASRSTEALRDLRHMAAISGPAASSRPIGSRTDTATGPVATLILGDRRNGGPFSTDARPRRRPRHARRRHDGALDQAVRRRDRRRGHQADRGARHDPRHHRSVRRGQDHARPDADRRPDAPEGKVRVIGEDPLSFRRETRERIGYMPQSFALYPELTTRENVDFVASLFGMLRTRRRRRTREVLQRVDLWDVRGRRAGRLSAAWSGGWSWPTRSSTTRCSRSSMSRPRGSIHCCERRSGGNSIGCGRRAGPCS